MLNARLMVKIALAAVFVFLAASLALPAIYEICGANEYTNAKECTQHHLPQWIFLWAVKIGDAHNGLITAAATVLLTWITLRLARLEKDSGDTRRMELRAYISAITKGITVAADGETLTIYVQLKNAGQTPAFTMLVPCGIAVLPPEDRFQVAEIGLTDADIQRLPPVTLPKDGGSVPHATVRLTYADKVRYNSAPHRIYAYGLITYQDVFGFSQWAEFCHYLEWERFSPFLEEATARPNEKIDISFKVAEFGQDTSLNPQHAPRMKRFWAGLGQRY